MIKLRRLSIISALILTLTACSNSSDQKDKTSGDNNQEADNLSISNTFLNPTSCSVYAEGLKLDKNHQKNGQITFANWNTYIAPGLPKCFEKLTGIHLIQSYSSDDNMLNARLLTGNTGYDVVVHGNLYFPSEIKAGSLEPIDKSKLSNYKYINKALYKKVANLDPGNKYGLIYSYGTTGIGYNVDKIDKIMGKGYVPNSWADLFDPKYLKKFQKCGISLLDEPEQVFGNLLFYLGKDPNSQNPEDYKEAAKYLIKNVRPYLTYFDSNRYQNDFASGNLCIVMGYSGDVLRAANLGKYSAKTNIRYVLPKEGAPIWFDMLAVPKGAPDQKNLYQFLNFNLNPRVAATNSNFLYQPNAVNGSSKYMLPLLQDKNVTPTPEMIDKMYQLYRQPPKLQEYINRLWMSVKYNIGDIN